jgi:HD-GYP domain-containing protein (c-di-GMP phosphodiesterase class II)
MMKSRFNLSVKIYIATIMLIAVYAAYRAVRTPWWDGSVLYGGIVFGILMVLSNFSPIKLPKVGSVNVTFALHLAAIFNFGPVISIVTEIFSSFIIILRMKEKTERIKEVFNVGQIIICIYIVSLITQPWVGNTIIIDMNLISDAFLVSFIYFLSNTLFVTLVISLDQQSNPWGTWLTNFKLLTPHYLTLAPLGLGVALIYYFMGTLGVVLFFLPLLLARHSFKLYMDMRASYLNTIETLMTSIEAKDPYTKGHSERVAAYSNSIGERLGLSDLELEKLNYLSLLHDIGKIAVNETLLNKSGKLSDEDFGHIKQHSRVGAAIIKNIKLLHEKDNEVVLHHHEKWDGSGYPYGIKGVDIPPLARIIAVADAFDAMTSDRSYRKALPQGKAVDELLTNAGKQFDPKVVEAFIQILPELSMDAGAAGTETTGADEKNANLGY